MMIDFLYIFLVLIAKVFIGRLANFKRKICNQDRKNFGLGLFRLQFSTRGQFVP